MKWNCSCFTDFVEEIPEFRMTQPYLLYRGGGSKPTRIVLPSVIDRAEPSFGYVHAEEDLIAGGVEGIRKRSLVFLLRRFAARTSMQGVSFLSTSKSVYAKVIWTVLLLAAFSFLTLHLQFIFTSYYSWPKQTTVELGFGNLMFPAITVCNVNALRLSKVHKASSSIKELVTKTNPQTVARRMGEELNNLVKHANVTTGFSYIQNAVELNSIDPRMNFGNGRGSAEDAGLKEKSMSASIQQEFLFKMADEPRKLRQELGHQMEDMLMDCAYSCQRCNSSNFKRMSTPGYGNCYTLENPKFMTSRSGPSSGLQLVLFLETDEYLPGITTGSGVQVVIHEPGTMPFPEEEGIAVAAGTETSIGLRQIRIERLPPPRWNCNNGEDFFHKYKLKYTRKMCQNACEQNAIVSGCRCYDKMKEDLNMALHNMWAPPCKNQSEVHCLMKVAKSFDQRTLNCSCDSPCSEMKYEKTISSRQWPTDSYAVVLKETLCQRKNSECSKLKKKYDSWKNLSQNFIKLNIFYEDLNYERINEKQDYEFFQFVSDVGGTLGLWLGLSVLSLFEVVQLILELCTFLSCGVCAKTPPKEDLEKNQVVKEPSWTYNPTTFRSAGYITDRFSGF